MVFLIHDKESRLVSRVANLDALMGHDALMGQRGGPVGGGIYVAGDDNNAYQFLPNRPGFRSWANLPNSGKTNAELTAEKLWGNPLYTQVEFEYTFTDYSDVGDGVNRRTVYNGTQKVLDYVFSHR